jgi:hypothetical protein
MTTPHPVPEPPTAARDATDPDLLRRVLAVAEHLEANAGLGTTWHTNMAAAARIREALGPEHVRPPATRREQMRAAMLAALNTPTPAPDATTVVVRRPGLRSVA